MATQTVEFRAATGLTLTVRLFAVGSDTIVQTASSCAEATNRKGTYAAVFTDPGAAEFELVAFSGGVPVCRWFCTLTLTTATFQAYEVRAQAVVGAVGSVTAGVTVTTNNDKTGYSLTATTGLGNQTANITGNLSGSVGSVTGAVGSVTARVTANTDQWGGATVTGMPLPTASYTAPLDATATAAAVWNAALATYTTAGSFGARVVRTDSASAGNGLKVTGAGHGAADIHEIQDGVITAADFAADWLTAAGIASDAVTKIQNGLATAANLLIANDRIAYALTALVGACSDAQTAAETYTLSINGNTFTVDYSGLDSSGNRGTTTLTKA